MGKLKVGEVLQCASAAEWDAWLAAHHASSTEIWLRLAKKGATAATVTRAEALESALCYGWIDGQAATVDESFWLQRFTPRTRRSKWSKINCAAVDALMKAGRMQPSGLAAVDAAKADGRWAAAYASPRAMQVPDDLVAELAKHPEAEAFFNQLDAQNRYAILYRIHDAKRADTRARRIAKFVGLLERGEKIH